MVDEAGPDSLRLGAPPAALRRAACHHRRVASRDRTLPVAVFDSGVGGLTVLHECLVSLPHEDFLYLGDTARFPYGDRSPEELLALRARARRDPARRGAPSCSWWRATRPPRRRCPRCAEELEQRVPVVGVVAPESRLAAAATRNGRVGLIATPATVASGAYARALAEAAPEARAPRGGLRRAGAADPGGRRGRPPHAELRRGRLPAAQAGRRGHRDPRLHPLPARPPRASARAGPRRGDRQLGGGDRRRGRVAPARRRASSQRRGPARATTASWPAATRRRSGAWARASWQLPIGEVEHVDVAGPAPAVPAPPGAPHERRPPATTAARPATCARSASTPASWPPPPARA